MTFSISRGNPPSYEVSSYFHLHARPTEFHQGCLHGYGWEINLQNMQLIIDYNSEWHSLLNSHQLLTDPQWLRGPHEPHSHAL